MTNGKRKAKSGATRTEVFAMRLDPKLKYLAEIAARKQRRSLANFMEWAIELGLSNTEIGGDSNERITVWDQSTKLWDVDEADRFATLAFLNPELMTYDEQVLWKLICETGYVWKGQYDSDGDWAWNASSAQALLRERLREKWADFKKVAAGEADRTVLPKISKKPPPTGESNPAKKPAGKFQDMDDDIPF
jgi:hypothetical protein